MQREMIRGADEIDALWRDGVVCLRGVIDRDWLGYLAEPIEHLMSATDVGGVDMTRKVAELRAKLAAGEVTNDPVYGDLKDEDFLEDDVEPALRERGRFFSLTHVNPISAPIRKFEMQSMLPQVAAEMTRASMVTLFVDQVFVKEPGTATRTVFHVDESYFNLSGEQVCTAWAPLDRVTSENGAMAYVRGSHLWQTRYLRNNFISQEKFGGAVDGRERLPDIEGEPDKFDIVSFDVEPGDVILHHYRTIHGSGGNRTANRRRRALAVRYCGDDVRWGPAGNVGERLRHNLKEGDPLERSGDVFPICWTAH